jgi:DNA-binding GntR family transcriptional regulator
MVGGLSGRLFGSFQSVGRGGSVVSLIELLEKFGHSGTMADAVYGALRHSIIHGDLRPGARLRADALAKEMNVSRTPVRDALRKLESEGLATMSARRGLIVPELSEDDLIETFQIRAVLEGLAARLAVDNATPSEIAKIRELMEDLGSAFQRGDIDQMRENFREFRQRIYLSSHSARLLQLLTALQDRGRQFGISTLYTSGRPQQTLEECGDLVKAIEARDGNLAEQLARDQRNRILTLRIQILREQRRNRRGLDRGASPDTPSDYEDIED